MTTAELLIILCKQHGYKKHEAMREERWWVRNVLLWPMDEKTGWPELPWTEPPAPQKSQKQKYLDGMVSHGCPEWFAEQYWPTAKAKMGELVSQSMEDAKKRKEEKANKKRPKR